MLRLIGISVVDLRAIYDIKLLHRRSISLRSLAFCCALRFL